MNLEKRSSKVNSIPRLEGITERRLSRIALIKPNLYVLVLGQESEKNIVEPGPKRIKIDIVFCKFSLNKFPTSGHFDHLLSSCHMIPA